MTVTRRLALAVLMLVVASCSGGGCSSGCSSCGIDPLPAGFPKPETIPNAASVRVSRPGLNFLQENLSVLMGNATGAKGGIASFAIPKSTQSGATICSPQNPVPPQCQAEIGVDAMKLRVDAITPNRVKIDGVLPVRIRDLPISFSFYDAYVVVGDATKAPGGDLCASGLRGSASFPFKEFPLNVELPLVTETRVPRDGYTKVDVDGAVIDIGITKNDVAICDDSGCGSFCTDFLNSAKDLAFNYLINGVKSQIHDALAGSFCTAPPCPTGSHADGNRCVFDDDASKCVPSLLGADGHVTLGKALARFSPGTTGGLDFVLASAGDMKPDPSDATLPAWTPRAPPVPAQDNNKNGISLAMLGGALPQPMSSCVDVVRRDPPKDIPVPQDLTGDLGGSHLGFALAQRYMDHALLGAYDSGALCLGISTEAVEQLNSGYLSLLAPSLKTLTLEGANAAAAITTRPGVPPRVTLGNAPLVTLSLDQFAVDFYVFSFDRYVRAFTYTSDLTIPIDLTTSKDGIRPVLGNIEVQNAHVSNSALLFEDDAKLADGITGLLGGIVGQFLGGGIAPIDPSAALASAGLGLEIPQGGIHKITTGKDDYLAVFANLKVAAKAAHEEADTRATLLETIVDPSAMALDTAVRARFPKLRVEVDGVASRPTEHTWWVDRGTRARWTTGSEILVDEDAMLLQGKHVLYVAARVVDDVLSEDTTPAAIPFTIDTLPPRIETKRDGSSVVVDAWDFVSPVSALRVRHRVAGGSWTEWRAVPETIQLEGDTEAEVADEEGNIGRVSLPLRGVADPTLAATGSGCSCRTAPGAPARGPGALAFLGAAAAAAGLVRARARRREVDS